MSQDPPPILPSDPTAATPCTLEGWISRDGYFYTSERTARWAGATHVDCTHCGKPSRKPYTACEPCRDNATFKRWQAMPERDPGEGEPIFSDTLDQYFWELDIAEEEAEERGTDLESLRLVCCEPVYARPIDSERWSDDLPEDQDPPDELLKAIDDFNQAISKLRLSWQPGKHRVRLPSTKPQP